MAVTVSVNKTNNLVDLDFNKELGIKPININDKFIGINTKDKGFQSLFGNNRILKQMFNGGYTKDFSKSFKAGPVSVDADAKLTFGSIYAKLGVVASAQFDLGGAKLGANKSGSVNLVSFTPETGNGIKLNAKTLTVFGATPKASFKLPTASLRLGLLGDANIAAVSLDSSLRGSLKYKGYGLSGSVDLPRISFPGSVQANIYNKDRKGNILPLDLINYSLADIAAGKPKPGSKPGTKGKPNLFDFEFKGVRITSDIRNPFAGAKITFNNSKTAPAIALSNRIPLVTASFSLNKLASNGYPVLKLLAERIKRDAYDVNYKLLDLSVNSELKIGYTGTVALSGYYSRATFENGQTLNLSGSTNQFSTVLNVLNTTELKTLLDTNGDGKATINFNFGYSGARLKLDFGLYANLFAQLDVGQLTVDVGSSIGFKNRFVKVSKDIGGRVIDFGPLYKGRLNILKDTKLPLPGLSGSKAIALDTAPFGFSERTTFNVPANADSLIQLLGLNPAAFYTVKGTTGNDNLVTRTEQGNDTFYGNGGVDTMRGGRGNDTYYISYAPGDASGDIVVEDAEAGFDTIVTYDSYNLPDHVEGLDSRAGNVAINSSGNALDNVMYAPTAPKGTPNLASVLYGKDGDDTLVGGTTGNYLVGGAGADRLTGGTGVTYFGFSIRDVAGASVDTITDFQSNDFIYFDANLFPGNSLQLELGTQAYSGYATILYDRSTGNLAYDADGEGGAAATVFARLEGRPALTRANLFTLNGFVE